MPFSLRDPFTEALMAAGLATGGNALGRFLGLPDEDDYRLSPRERAELIRLHSLNVNRTAGGQAALAGQNAAEVASANGLNGGALTQAVTGAQAPIYQEASDSINRFDTDLTMQDAMGRMQYRRDRRNANAELWGGLFGDAAGGLGAYASIKAQDEALNRLINTYSGSGSSFTATQGIMGPRVVDRPAMQPAPVSMAAPFGKTWGSQPEIGFKAGPLMFDSQKQLNNPWERPRIARRQPSPFSMGGRGGDAFLEAITSNAGQRSPWAQPIFMNGR